MVPRIAAASVFVLALAGAATARADGSPSPGAGAAKPDLPSSGTAADRTAAALDAPYERRSGLVLGFDGGYGFGSSSGYPNNSNYIDNPSYYSASGPMFGSGGGFFVMGALTDYLTFGFFFGGGSYQNNDWKVSGGGVGFRVEAFPLYTVAPWLRDLGVMAQFGIGSSKLEAKFRPNTGADGAESLLGAGIFYEWKIFRLFGGHVATGPELQYNAIVTRAIETHGGVLGGRFIFYGGI